MTTMASSPPANVDAYIATFSPKVQALLQKVRKAVRSAAPKAEEVISYRMPALKLNGMLVYFAAFKNHIGFYPPIRGDAILQKASAKYAGTKGNLRFPFDDLPLALIKKLTALRVEQDLARAALRKKLKPKTAPKKKRS
jgi:uncharacterized protein YdhG (YjbR/CyaY superfamily)